MKGVEDLLERQEHSGANRRCLNTDLSIQEDKQKESCSSPAAVTLTVWIDHVLLECVEEQQNASHETSHR